MKAERIGDPGAFGRLVEHTTFIYLIGPGGEGFSVLPPMLPPGRIAAIVRSYSVSATRPEP